MPPILFDTNLVIAHIRQRRLLPLEVLFSVVVTGELEAFALKIGWEASKVTFMRQLLDYHPQLEISRVLVAPYARVDAYSQGRLPELPLPSGMSARNMGKNDLWIAATALHFELPLHTTDRDFDHLGPLGLRVVRP